MIKDNKNTIMEKDFLSKDVIKEMSYTKLLSVIVSGRKFKHDSYDHKKAMEEYINNNEFINMRKTIKSPRNFEMPVSLKIKYKIEKIGKLRRVHFNPQGKAYKFEIGAKYAKTYGIDDFGVNVFPCKLKSNY